MTNASSQVVKAFEDLGMSPEEIAEDQDLDVVAVKSILAQFSHVYKQKVKGSPEIGFTEDQHQAAVDVIAQLAMYGEDERVRLRAAMFLRDDKKGRRDVLNMTGLNINVLTFNETMKKALLAKERSKTIVDVKPETKVLEETNR